MALDEHSTEESVVIDLNSTNENDTDDMDNIDFIEDDDDFWEWIEATQNQHIAMESILETSSPGVDVAEHASGYVNDQNSDENS